VYAEKGKDPSEEYNITGRAIDMNKLSYKAREMLFKDMSLVQDGMLAKKVKEESKPNEVTEGAANEANS
jgi:hypothetical protein